MIDKLDSLERRDMPGNMSRKSGASNRMGTNETAGNTEVDNTPPARPGALVADIMVANPSPPPTTRMDSGPSVSGNQLCPEALDIQN